MTFEKSKELIVGVDVGNGTICTARKQFRASIKEMESAVAEHKAVIDGVSYVIGEGTWTYKVDRTIDDDAKLITHYAVACELLARNLQPGKYEITLGVGLPFQHWASLKGSLKEYYRDCKEHTVTVDRKTYCFEYKSVAVMPQGYSALVGKLNDLRNRTVVLADIGEGTLDVVLYENAVPKETCSYTDEYGVEKCFQTTQRIYKDKELKTLSRNQFEQVITGNCKPSHNLMEYVTKAEREYSKELMNILVQGGYNSDLMSLIIMGGGANIVKQYGGEEFAQAEYILDQKANAQGYEEFLRQYKEGR